MAKDFIITFPLDQPRVSRPGVLGLPEGEEPGSMVHLADPDLTSEVERAKGNLGFTDLPPPLTLEGGGVPFRKLTKGDSK